MELWASVWVCDVCVCVEEREKKEGGEREREKGIQVTAKVLSVKKLRWKKELNVIPWKM